MQCHGITGAGLKKRPIHHWTKIATQIAVLDVLHDSDHFRQRTRRGPTHLNPLTDRIVPWPKQLRHSLVDNHDGARRFSIPLIELATAQEWNGKRVKVARRDEIGINLDALTRRRIEPRLSLPAWRQ